MLYTCVGVIGCLSLPLDLYPVQRPAAPIPLLASIAEELGSSSSPADQPSPRHLPPLPLPPPTPGASSSLSPASGCEGDNRSGECPVKRRGDSRRPPVLHRTTSSPAVPIPREARSPEDLTPLQNGLSPVELTPNHGKAQCPPHGRTKEDLETDMMEVPSVSGPQKARALFGGSPSRTPFRRSKSEGYVRTAAGTQEMSPMPEICTDATMYDQLWNKLEAEPGSHRDSVSSSSSISSNDTVIDLSLPNLSRKSFTCLSGSPSTPEPVFQDPPSWVNRPRSAITSFDTPRVSKSKSNPNLRQGHPGEPADELQPRPLGVCRESPVNSPSRIAQRRHTWSRLYMEGLKQSSSSAKNTSAAAAALTASRRDAVAPMSKSLGDLTSDDITCNFDSKYRSISRSIVARPSPRRGLRLPRAPGDLTERLRRLTDVEPLTARDFAPQTGQERVGDAEEEEEPQIRRMSSRSQSRVRYIANRAKQAQERQRLLGLHQPQPGDNTSSSGSPIEERGNPEGACCIARSPCASLDLLGQLSPPGPAGTQAQTSLNSDNNNELFFRLKL
ncbi:hypothetical protein UPYG_G00004690 [Umbra pygmaea]|uniref:Uncharacterized protein n=1 Tax=Umbra pygmaea TaxID=75934 RepID=A0ABD0XJP7_UMBPY